MLDPEGFSKNERNQIYLFFVKRFGFRFGSILQILFVEIPAVLIFAFLPLPVFYWFLTGNQPSIYFSVFASMTLFLAAHIHATMLNLDFARTLASKLQNKKAE